MKDAALVPDIDSAAALEAATSFAALTRHGPLRLLLRSAAPPPARAPASVRAAALLAGAEPLLQWLEDWLGEALDPVPEEDLVGTPGVHLHWRLDAVAATVEVPWPAMLAARPASELARFWRDAVQWEPLALELVLARERLDDDEWQQLQQPGAGWLMRDSFSADGHWRCELRLAGDDRPGAWPAQWHPGSARLGWDALGCAPTRTDLEATQAVLAAPLHMTPPQLLGWHGEPAFACRPDQPVALRPALRHGRRASRGHLLPIGLRASGSQSALEPAALHAGWVLRLDPEEPGPAS